MNIRKAEIKDLEIIREIEKEAFSKYLNTNFARRIENLKLNYVISEGGLFIAESEGEINGFIYSRTLGKIGWIGTFAVQNKMQNRGIGKALLTKAIEFLESEGCEIIGLETINSAYKNIEIYIKNGFNLITPSLQLTRKIELGTGGNYSINFDKKYIMDLSEKILTGYNPIKLFESAANEKWGDTIEFYDNGCQFGVAILEYAPKLENEQKGTLTINTLLIDEKDELKIKKSIREINAYAIEKGFEAIDIFINASNEITLKTLLNIGFSIKNSRARMLRKGKYNLNGIECSRWIM